MVLYIYFDNEIMNGNKYESITWKNPCQNENKFCLIFS